MTYSTGICVHGVLQEWRYIVTRGLQSHRCLVWYKNRGAESSPLQESRKLLLLLILDSDAGYIPGTRVLESHRIPVCACLVWYKNHGAESSPRRVDDLQ